MGRSPKKGVDYFSHDVLAALGPTLFTVQNAYGNDGYAFFFKLWEFVGTKSELYLDFSTEKDWLYFIAVARVTPDKGEEIMTLLASLDAIDSELWRKHRVVWSDNFAGRVASVFRKRGEPVPTRPTFEEEKQEDKGSPEPRPQKRKKKTEDDEGKKKYAEFVSMTEAEYKALVERIGEKATEKCIEVLDNYKGSSGKTYKSDYRTILNWVIEKVRKEHKELFVATASTKDDGSNPFDEYSGG